MKSLVTGANGFAGGYLTKHLVDERDDVYATFLPSASPTSVASPRNRPLDVRERAACLNLIQEIRPEVIYHLAGISFVPTAEKDFSRAVDINVDGTFNIIRACIDAKVPATIVFISSAEVYGKVCSEDLPLREELPTKPQTNYSLTKLMAELVCQRFAMDGFVKTVVIRAFNHIGIGQSEQFVVANFANQLAAIAAQKAPPVIRVGNLEAKRDFVDVRDIVRGYRLAALKGGGVYNLCSGKSVAIKTILDSLIEISGLSVTIEEDPDRMRPSDIPEIRGSFEKAKRELGWEPRLPLMDTLQRIYEHYLQIHGVVSNPHLQKKFAIF